MGCSGKSGPDKHEVSVEGINLLNNLTVDARRPPAALPNNAAKGILDLAGLEFLVWEGLERLLSLRKQGGGQGYVALREKRLMTRTEMQSSWVPNLVPPSLANASSDEYTPGNAKL